MPEPLRRGMLVVLATCAVATLAGCGGGGTATPGASEEQGRSARLASAGGTVELCLLVADSAAARQVGLSGRESLGAFDGMLFVFDRAGTHRFWMKDTLIPLELVPVAADATLGAPIEMQPCPHGSTCPQFGPDTAYDRALEFDSGFLAEAGLDPVATPVKLELDSAACATPGG